MADRVRGYAIRQGGEKHMAEKVERTEESKKAEEALKRHEEAKDTIKELEDDPPKELKDWPDDESKYLTFGGSEGDHGYEEGPESKLGPSSLERHEDGSVSIEGEKVDDPDEYKGEPIPGGPTDPNAPNIAGEKDDDAPEPEDAGDKREAG
jgi:hypothetical protein